MNKDIENIEENIIGFDALYNSMEKCKRGVIWKDGVAHYCLNGIEETIKLERQLKTDTYKAHIPVKFTITAPKRREIVSIAFRDRVYQRSLNDNAIYPQMSKRFIYDNLACQRGKGTDLARERLKKFLQRAYRKWGTDFYVLQGDIHGYYPNMRHDVAKAVFKKGLDRYTYERAERALDDQYDGEIGFNPGSQMVQIAGISVLDGIDHYTKERLRIEKYGRYMDDFIQIHPDAQYLEQCKEDIETKLHEIGFEYNEKKTKVYSIKEGIPFLGFIFKVTDSGKVIMLLKPENIKQERKKLRRLVHKAKRGEITKEKVDFCYKGWKAHAEKGNSYKLLKRMDEYYKNLWKEEVAENGI